MLTRDWQTWDRRLERLGAELEGCRTFLGRPGRIVVLDTSALMEGVLFTRYDWHTLDAGLAAGAVRLIVPDPGHRGARRTQAHPGPAAEG